MTTYFQFSNISFHINLNLLIYVNTMLYQYMGVVLLVKLLCIMNCEWELGLSSSLPKN